MHRLLVTLDTTELDRGRLGRVQACLPIPYELACVTVSRRERGNKVTLEVTMVPEAAVWGQSRWGEAVWGDPLPEPFVLGETPLGDGALGAEAVGVFEQALAIISNRSFPVSGQRDHLTRGQQHQLRDAMIFEAHVRHGRHVLVTNDKKGFVNGGRREQLERLGQTRIETLDELEDLAAERRLESLFRPRA